MYNTYSTVIDRGLTLIHFRILSKLPSTQQQIPGKTHRDTWHHANKQTHPTMPNAVLPGLKNHPDRQHRPTHQYIG